MDTDSKLLGDSLRPNLLQLVCRYTATTQHRQRLADLSAAWQRQRRSFIADSEQMLAEAAAAEAVAAEAAAVKLAWEANGQMLHSQLEQLQEVKQRQQQVFLPLSLEQVLLTCHCCIMHPPHL